MLRDITLGQYYPADSILHRLDPRVKFVGTIVYVVSLFLFHNWGYLLGTVFLAVMIKLSKVPFKFITKGLKSIFVLPLLPPMYLLQQPQLCLLQNELYHQRFSLYLESDVQ